MFNEDGTLRINSNYVHEKEEVKKRVGRPKLTGELQRIIVRAIVKNGSATYHDLIKETGRSQQSVSNAVIRLESLRILKRTSKIIDYGIDSINPQKVAVFTLRAI